MLGGGEESLNIACFHHLEQMRLSRKDSVDKKSDFCQSNQLSCSSCLVFFFFKLKWGSIPEYTKKHGQIIEALK